MSSEQIVKHLWDCALSLNAETHSKKLLLTYFINTSRNLAGKKDDIPLERFASSQMCERCSTHWQDNEFQMKLKPQKIDPKTSKARRLIAKLKAQQSASEQRLLTKKQKKRAKWLLKHAESKVEIKCALCEHKTFVALNKPTKEKSSEKIVQIDDETPAIVEPPKSKKKKKNKDTTAGLRIPKTKKLEIQEKVSMNKKTVKDSRGSKIATTPLKNVQAINSKPIKTKSKNILKKEAVKVQSKTQKQNSLLQLAALLKSKDQYKTIGSSSAKNRLESLLK